MSIKIINPGMFTTVQDLGRRGYQKYGIPPSGALDSYSLQLANLLVGNDKGEACLEATIAPPTIGFNKETWFSVTGGDWRPKLNGKELPAWKSIPAMKGDKLSFESKGTGMRVYISFSGGIDIPTVLGSKSTYARAALGGFKGRSLEQGDVLEIRESRKIVSQEIPEEFKPDLQFENIAVILGPQEDHFSEKGLENFLNSKYTVRSDSDRMGIRFDGPSIEHSDGADIISEAVAGGSVQVPGNGKPIILLSDRQTTGGYTKLATVIKAAGSKLAQMKPGDEVSFREISLEKAYTLRKKQLENLKELEDSLKKNKLTSKERFNISVGNKTYSVGVELQSADRLQATVEDEEFTISLMNSEKRKGTTQTSEEDSLITAPMPGEIISIEISEGDSVSEGETLIVLEAMKMENNISAPFPGTISTIYISEGDEVQDGEKLLTMKK